MKTMWAVGAIVLLLVRGNTYGEEPATHYYNHRYVRNTTFPPDCVELAAGSPSQGFYRTPPKERPATVPPTCVLVRVFGQHGEFIGWIYMHAEAVKFLHLAQPTRK
jgi:hypothetical protein